MAVDGVDTLRTSMESTPSSSATVSVSVSTWVLPGADSVTVMRNTGSSLDSRDVLTDSPAGRESIG